MFAVLAALLVLLAVHRRVGRYGLLGVIGYWALLRLASFAAVGVSGGTSLYLLFFGLAMFGFLRSGGLNPSLGP
ncbi:hypothetical protein [Deinococcus altitudinis]|uniref:hypothetical protein n=1 Tax=Deinococcus altitudinis TaxID=468914 RepID=UPI003891C591